MGAPIRCAEQVLTEAGIVIPDEQEDEVEKFREFLDQVGPEDFAGLSPARSADRGQACRFAPYAACRGVTSLFRRALRYTLVRSR